MEEAGLRFLGRGLRAGTLTSPTFTRTMEVTRCRAGEPFLPPAAWIGSLWDVWLVELWEWLLIIIKCPSGWGWWIQISLLLVLPP